VKIEGTDQFELPSPNGVFKFRKFLALDGEHLVARGRGGAGQTIKGPPGTPLREVARGRRGNCATSHERGYGDPPLQLF